MNSSNRRVAIYIDAENISHNYASRLIEEASSYGDVIIKRVYADWSDAKVNPWKEAIAKYALVPEQQFPAVKGKNTSDITLIIDVIKALFERSIDVFCLASSDSDFTRLVQELKEREKLVVGLGESKTTKSYVNAFSEFVYLNDNIPDNNIVKKADDKANLLPDDKYRALIEIIELLLEDNGKAYYSQIGNEMKNKYADFIPKNYGCKTMKEFMDRYFAHNTKYVITVGEDTTSLYLTRASASLAPHKTAKPTAKQPKKNPPKPKK